jgi:hypothetical protein
MSWMPWVVVGASIADRRRFIDNVGRTERSGQSRKAGIRQSNSGRGARTTATAPARPSTTAAISLS